ncbi:hypothetical protein A2526_00015 [candidate division WOR-1 bacterium RIFOXYD2_FULL_36_8]|uniref:Uncharacterized protein n=1 Tax=candidate division WOR-1 bacterium RIFOXYB2_FULL_36_35 TaxID=1802578 RepID=A0A1F4S4F4_UNCSA|nr:MAG: hypothetical protein A2230_08055 [candidate division WOR-1 bacterium RIFOXYA2_FULL_36_21]OGC14315.1 MAG: hypothetical protein A2282_00135 [candidate division WOR-1 bacterium RIFOXYA12_FULL_36_13]OGC15314.1 MAG: hypothetical protein A2290_05150 [candidate division WOR-1 bacterium RIFOXYB2_FULL_36_35]OGC37589.1 MAG: hypothetical protein A2526_00015 [candidate division WOR-1 bacterium RIFOXYD2_FULL_36_8]
MNQVIVSLDKDYNLQDVSEVLNSMFHEKLNFAQYKVDKYKDLCSEFEKKHKIDSEQFLNKFENGETGDDADYFNWFAAKKGLDLWTKKLSILKSASIK